MSRTPLLPGKLQSAFLSLVLPMYSLLLMLALLMTAPWWLWQMARTSKYREGIAERFGRIPLRLLRPRRPAIWLHAVSVGEVLAASRLVQELDELSLQTGEAAVYLSTTTRTGQTLARERFGGHRVFYFPLDFAFAMRAWIRFLRPAMVVLVESEFWPRMLVECRRTEIPVVVVNARISDRSWPRYQRLRALWRPLLGTLALTLAQSERDASRLRSLGAVNATANGNLKYDIRVPAPLPITAVLGAHLSPGTRVVVCGSTLAGEEALLLDALPLAEIITILAPRHPERFDEVARLLAERGIVHLRRSRWRAPVDTADKTNTGVETDAAHGAVPELEKLGPGTVLLLDSIGELASVYSLATLAILGGGFLFSGGHNPLEPAQFGVPVLMGDKYRNFRDVVDALRAREAVILTDPDRLATTLTKLLDDPTGTRAIGERGRLVCEQQAGATARTLVALFSLLETHSAVDPAASTSAPIAPVAHS